MSSTPAAELVTVYIPCFNVAPYLPAAIESVLAQTHRELELLVIVDQASTDDTPAIARHYADRDDRIRLIDVPHCPLTHKYQLGAEEAKGTWLSPLDGDDAFRPSKIERQLAAAAGAPEVVGWACWYSHIGADGNHIRDTHHGPTTRAVFDELRARHEVPMVVHGTLIRREAFFAAGGYDHALQLAADFDLIDRLCDQGPLLALPEVLMDYRLSYSSASLNKFREQNRQIDFVFDRRRRADAGRPTVSFEEYLRLAAGEPWWRRLDHDARERSRYHWRATGTALGGHDKVAAARSALLALAWHPAWAGSRMVHQFVLPRLPGRGPDGARLDERD